MSGKWIISDLSREVQGVGIEALKSGKLQQVEEGVFGTSPLVDANRTDRLTAHAGTDALLVEVGVADTDRLPGGLLDAFGITESGNFIQYILTYDGNEEPDWMNPEQQSLRYNHVKMALQGGDSIRLDGGPPRNTVEAVHVSSSLDGYNLPEGYVMQNGKTNRVSGGSTFSYEGVGGVFSSGTPRMRDILQLVRNTLLLPEHVAVTVDEQFAETRSEVANYITETTTPDDLLKMIAEELGDRTDAEVRIGCFHSLFAREIIGQLTYGGLTQYLPEYTGREVPPLGAYVKESEDGFGRMKTTIVLEFGDVDAIQEQEDTPLIDVMQLQSIDTISALATAGWTALVNRDYDASTGIELIQMTLHDSGGSNGENSVEIAARLGFIDIETGEMQAGFSVSEESGRVTISYKGEINSAFNDFANRLLAR